jgi:hypothetical protein
MPKIPMEALDNVIYLYRDVESAVAGTEFGGTGFLVHLKSSKYPTQIAHTYAVTNWHVAVRGGASIIRLNRKDGGTRLIPAGPEEWVFDQKLGYDIAVLPVDIDEATDQIAFVDAEDGIITKQTVIDRQLGPGEDVFMVGRFVDHDGGPVNKPAVRFGNISVMPTPLMQPTGVLADSFCIDMHSRSGYSGSPVWVFRTPGYDLTQPLGTGSNAKILLAGNNLFCLLGIHYDQFPEAWPVSGEAEIKPLKRDGTFIKGLSGMTKVLPGWAILELLNIPALVQQRAEGDAHWMASNKLDSSGEVAKPEKPTEKAAVEPATDNRSHKEDFMSLLNAAAKAKKPAS